ncbi:MAG: hypothetical protein QHH06_08640 [Clostridiales bacterium]|jgi:hypothetical protein|nr:hypothetical protein [Eubacteriales bacterium]MDH7566534.1 hypothetical protein [Clostridiales bacterium]
MADRKNQPGRRRYYLPDTSIKADFPNTDGSPGKNSLEEAVSIPPPNEFESIAERKFGRKPVRSSRPNFLDIFRRIKVDEIILIGLIFVLLDEGIEDELLLVVLVYLLLSGRE